MTTILVAYASKHHSTEGIAYRIGSILRQPCIFEVDVRPAAEVVTLAPYDVVILGSAVYMGQWQPAAIEFLSRFEGDLKRRDVWLFSSGPTGMGNPLELLKGWTFPEPLIPTIDNIQPHDIALFHGKLDTAELNIMERAAVAIVKAPIGDFRQWEMIDAWAEGIVQTLREKEHA